MLKQLWCLPVILLLLSSNVQAQEVRKAGSSNSWQWMRINAGIPGLIGYIAPRGNGLVYATTATIFYRSLDAGQTWTELATSPAGGAKRILTDTDFLAFESPNVFKSTDAGKNWRAIRDSQQALITAITSVGIDTVFIVSIAELRRSTNQGITWIRDAFLPFHGITGIAFQDHLNGVMVGAVRSGPKPGQYGAESWITSDAGVTWVQKFTGAQEDFLDVTACGNDTYVATGGTAKGAGMMRTTNGGQTWDSVNVNAGKYAFSHIASHGSTLVAVGYGGTIAHSTDGGVTWVFDQSGTLEDLTSIAFYDDTTVLIGGDKGLLYRTTMQQAQSIIAKDSILSKILVTSTANSVRFEWDQAAASRVYLSIFNTEGALAVTLLHDSFVGSGHQRVDCPITSLGSGSYLYKFSSGSDTLTGRFNITK